MTVYLDALMAFISHHYVLAYVVVFAVSLSESLAIVGLLVPGTVIMFGIGALVSTGALRLLPVLLLAMTGAVAGDGLSFWLGYHYKERLVNFYPFSRHPEMLKKGEAFFLRHGGKGVLFGRFVGPIRPVIPLVAGMLGMKPLYFIVVNVISAVGWAFAYVLPGVFFGTSLAMAGAISTRLAVVVFLLVAGIWGTVWIFRRLGLWLVRKWPEWLSRLKRLPVLQTSPLKPILNTLFSRQKRGGRLTAFLAVILLLGVWGFLGVLQDILTKDPLVFTDRAVYRFLQSLRTSWFDSFFVAVTELGDSFTNVCVSIVVVVVLLAGRCRRTALLFGITAAGGFSGVHLLKWIFQQPRPVALSYTGATSYGFPSGHSAMSVIIFGLLAILISRKLSASWRWALFTGVLFISFVVGFSRLYLGAHWLSDVLGGYFIGACWTAFMGIIILKKTDEMVPRRMLGLTVALVIIVIGGWHVSRNHEKDLVFYARHHEDRTVTFSAWQSGGWKELPAWRLDMEGEFEQPLTFQWAGSVETLSDLLKKNGWQPPPPFGLKTFLGIFSADTTVDQLPLLPRLHDGRSEALCLVRTEHKKRLVLRIWAADVRVEATGAPVFVGYIEEQQSRLMAHLLMLAKNSGDFDLPLRTLEQSLQERGSEKLVHRLAVQSKDENTREGFHWSGEVLLGW